MSKTNPLRIRLALIAVMTNVGFWLWLFQTGQDLPIGAYADPEPVYVVLPSGGVQFNMCHDCGLGFVLAGREVPLYRLTESLWIRFVLLLNAPALFAGEAARDLLAERVGLYGATWLATAVIAVVTLVQWSGFGWLLGMMAPRLAITKTGGGHP